MEIKVIASQLSRLQKGFLAREQHQIQAGPAVLFCSTHKIVCLPLGSLAELPCHSARAGKIQVDVIVPAQHQLYYRQTGSGQIYFSVSISKTDTKEPSDLQMEKLAPTDLSKDTQQAGGRARNKSPISITCALSIRP